MTTRTSRARTAGWTRTKSDAHDNDGMIRLPLGSCGKSWSHNVVDNGGTIVACLDIGLEVGMRPTSM